MMKFIVYLGVLLSILGADDLIDQSTPKGAVSSYYYAMNNADLDLLDKVMVKDSYDETVQVYALSIGFQDRVFMKVLKKYGEDLKAKEEVKDAVERKLRNLPAKVISELTTTPLGKSRAMIRYKEDGKKKQLYTSLHGNKTWKIDYLAGREVD